MGHIDLWKLQMMPKRKYSINASFLLKITDTITLFVKIKYIMQH